MLKCHVFRCDVPAKAIASALHGLCAQVRAKSGAGNVGKELGLKLPRWLGQGGIGSLTSVPLSLYLMLVALCFRSCQSE